MRWRTQLEMPDVFVQIVEIIKARAAVEGLVDEYNLGIIIEADDEYELAQTVRDLEDDLVGLDSMLFGGTTIPRPRPLAVGTDGRLYTVTDPHDPMVERGIEALMGLVEEDPDGLGSYVDEDTAREIALVAIQAALSQEAS